MRRHKITNPPPTGGGSKTELTRARISEPLAEAGGLKTTRSVAVSIRGIFSPDRRRLFQVRPFDSFAALLTSLVFRVERAVEQGVHVLPDVQAFPFFRRQFNVVMAVFNELRQLARTRAESVGLGARLVVSLRIAPGGVRDERGKRFVRLCVTRRRGSG